MTPDRHEAPFLLFTCEHAGREVPRPYRALFRGAGDVLRSHRGWDPGSLGVAQHLAASLSAPLLACLTTRLLIEPNRSPDHPQLFSEFTRGLDDDARARLVRELYEPHRAAVAEQVRLATEAGRPVVHVGVHSFIDELDGSQRALDAGLLFDPARRFESDLCARWREAIERADPAGEPGRPLRVRFNEPYLGIDDGLTAFLRTRFADDRYAGIELELRQGLLARAPVRRRLAGLLGASLRGVLNG